MRDLLAAGMLGPFEPHDLDQACTLIAVLAPADEEIPQTGTLGGLDVEQEILEPIPVPSGSV